MKSPFSSPRPGPSFEAAQAAQHAKFLAQQGELREADALCRKILAVVPDQFDALHLLCHISHRAGRLADAVSFGRKALNQRPQSIDAMLTLGFALAAAGRTDEALARFEKALALDPRHFGVLNNLGALLQSQSRLEEAIVYFERAIAAEPDRAEAENNLASALLAAQRPALAVEHYRRAQLLAPNDPVARYAEATAQLLSGDYSTGWETYETRWLIENFKLPRWSRAEPLWRGDVDLSGKTIFIWSEQGLGDTLQFCRYVPLVAQRGARVILGVQPELVALMAALDGPETVFSNGTLGAFDYHCPLMSLPLAFGTTVETIPNRVPYLAADPAKAAHWQARLGNLPGRRVGLVWFGSSPSGNSAVNNVDRRRSLPLAALAPLAKIPGVSFVSLQLGKPVHPGAVPPGLVLHDWTADIKDFSDTAALVDGLDLVISVDTSTAHLAGALGKPVWLMNRFDTCWRWLLNCDDSPWYPTLRQFRQPTPGDWNAVASAIAAALGEFAAGSAEVSA